MSKIIKVMIMSLGGSPEPLSKSIDKYKPERVIFFASHKSVHIAKEVFDSASFKPTAEYEITEDHNNLFACYEKARNCVSRLAKWNVPEKDVMVDYTGGTKVMVAALVLATIGRRFLFNYVGGDQRNKDGLGTVVDGYERMICEASPWSVYAEEERRRIVTLFNNQRYTAVSEIIESYSDEIPRKISRYFAFVNSIAKGLACWDQFCHADTREYLKKGCQQLDIYLEQYPDLELQRFKKQVASNIEFLNSVLRETQNLKNLHLILVEDLLNNARRRIREQRYDDATARVYRALEMYGQIYFKQVAGCSNSKVAPNVIPESLREVYVRKYIDKNSGMLKLPLAATFQYLKAKGYDAGVRYFENEKELKNILSNRNASILAHGTTPIGEHAIQSIFRTVTEFIQITDFFDFPVLP